MSLHVAVKMSNYALSRNIFNVTKKLLWTSACRSIRQAPRIVDNVNLDKQPDLPVKLKKNPFAKEQPKCILCKLNIEPDYKNVRLLSQFQSRYTGRIYGRHITGLCQSKQEKLEREILKSQNAGLMPYYLKEQSYARDPQLFDPDHPFRPHKY